MGDERTIWYGRIQGMDPASVLCSMSLRRLWKISVAQIRRTRFSQTRFQSLLERLDARGARARYGEQFEWQTQSEVEEQDEDADACIPPPILFPSFPSAHSDLVHRNITGHCG